MLSRRSFLKANFKANVQPVRLPWLKDEASFVEHCTRCMACIKSCPEKIITQGDGGFPKINFKRGECTFCAECAQSCPENLFINTNNLPWLLTAHITEQCLTLKNVVCVSCKEQCETEAIQFVAQIGKVSQPVISAEKCTGCGACVKPCPTDAINIFNDNEFNYQQVENI